MFDPEPRRRYPRGQSFKLSPAGRIAEDLYQQALAGSREQGGRAAFDEATAGWAAPLGIRPSDAVFLSELRAESRTVAELAQALASCGVEQAEARSAIDRLVDAGLVEPLPAALR